MYKNFLRYLISAIFLITFSISAKADFKVGFVYIGPTGDHGWTYQHDEGRKAVEAAGIKTTYVESVKYGADAERVIRQLAQSGHDLILPLALDIWMQLTKLPKTFRT